jgi:hypothetical protein
MNKSEASCGLFDALRKRQNRAGQLARIWRISSRAGALGAFVSDFAKCGDINKDRRTVRKGRQIQNFNPLPRPESSSVDNKALMHTRI